MLSDAAVREAVRLFLAARGDHRQFDGLPDSCRPQTVADGYQIQTAVAEAIGLPCVGWKIACTSDEACQILGAEGPFAGREFEPFVVDSPAELSAGAFHMRGLEGEFAFRLGDDLPEKGGPYAAEDMASAIECLYPAIEIVDTRYSDWLNVGAAQLAADNAATGALVLGPPVTGWMTEDLAAVDVALSLNDKVKREGSGADVLGHPLAALAWLANDRIAHGDGLKAGEVVTTGTCTGIVFADAGDAASANFGSFGTVTVSFTD